MKSYLEHFFSLRCCPDLLPFFGPNRRSPKEITESTAMYRAAVDILKVSPKEPVTAIVVGDGKRPRTAGLLSHITHWDCVSIDPIADLEWWEQFVHQRSTSDYPMRRLEVYKLRAEEARIHCAKQRAILFLPHAHVGLETSLRVPYEYTRLDIVAMPCCTPIEEKYLGKKFAIDHHLFTYVDVNVWSPLRTVYVWQNL